MTLEVITGPMFSGKSTELIRLVEREVFARRRAAIFEGRFGRAGRPRALVTHNGLRYEAYTVYPGPSGIGVISRRVEGESLDTVGVDEVNFFPDSLVRVLDRLADKRHVIACGLNLNFRAEPFETTMELVARADRVRYLSAVCVVCGGEATRTQKLMGGKPAPRDSPVIAVGGKGMYEPRCRRCFESPR